MDDRRKAVLDKIQNGESLTDYDFSGIDLSGIDLSLRDLSNADFSDARLTEANLSSTLLARANFDGADLNGADLKLAKLYGTTFREAQMVGADLRYAIINDCYFVKVDLLGARFNEATIIGSFLTSSSLIDVDFRNTKFGVSNIFTGCLMDRVLVGTLFPLGTEPFKIPVIEDIDRKILDLIEDEQNHLSLDMSRWRTEKIMDLDDHCGSTYCRAGFAILLAGIAGAELEKVTGAAGLTGALIYAASRPGVPVPNFYASNEAAMEDLRRCAAGKPQPLTYQDLLRQPGDHQP